MQIGPCSGYPPSAARGPDVLPNGGACCRSQPSGRRPKVSQCRQLIADPGGAPKSSRKPNQAHTSSRLALRLGLAHQPTGLPSRIVGGHREPSLDRKPAPAPRSAAPPDDAPQSEPRRKVGLPGTSANSAPARPGSVRDCAIQNNLAKSSALIDTSIACRHVIMTFHPPLQISNQGTSHH
jgi:hypothetical protein